MEPAEGRPDDKCRKGRRPVQPAAAMEPAEDRLDDSWSPRTGTAR